MRAGTDTGLAIGARRVPSRKVALMAHLVALVTQLSRSQTRNRMTGRDLAAIREIRSALREIQGLLRQVTGEDPDVE